MPFLLQSPYYNSSWSQIRYDIAKRYTDILICLLLLPFCLVICLLLSLVIKLESRGPVLFTQWRAGLNGKQFCIYKLRSLYSSVCDKTGGAQITSCDKRLTRTGYFMRKYSLDEIPQIFNILKGDMSLVGPRPHAIDHHAYYISIIPYYDRRLSVLPGLTGLAQINGCRGSTAEISLMQARFDLDLVYISKRTYLGDLKILYLTMSQYA